LIFVLADAPCAKVRPLMFAHCSPACP
jgi:hypothetical protein